MHDTDFVVKKRCGWLTALKVILAVAAIAFVAYKIYQKFFKKSAEAIEEPVENDEILLEEVPAEEAFEASAEDVIASAEGSAE